MAAPRPVTNDYVELYNPTSAAISVAGTSVQYRSASGTTNPTGVTPLSGSIPAKGYYLVALGGGATGAALPPADATGSTQMSATAGTVFLADQATALTAPPPGSVTGNPAVIDVVGYGGTNTFETAPTSAPSAATSVARDAAGKDTDDNSADFTVAAGTPGAAPAGGGGGPTTPPEAHPIADIQGTGDASPLVGRTVVTDGVVTAAYPTGGLNGFYLQTAGTGGDTDTTTRRASDAVFVYGSAATAVVRVGDHVEVTGKVTEFNGLTEVTPAGASDVRTLSAAAAPRPAAIAVPREAAQREAFEGMLLAPRGPTRWPTTTPSTSTPRSGWLRAPSRCRRRPRSPTRRTPPRSPRSWPTTPRGGSPSTTGPRRTSSPPARTPRCRGSPRSGRSGSARRRRSPSRWSSTGATARGGSSRPAQLTADDARR